MTQFGPGFLRSGDPNTLALLHMDGAPTGTVFNDSANPSRIWTARNTCFTSTNYGQPNASFNTSCDCGLAQGFINTPSDPIFNLGSGPFTVDFWFWIRGGDNSERDICGLSASGGTALNWGCAIGSTNKCISYVAIGGTAYQAIGTTSCLQGTVWRHFASVRSGDTLMTFLDGTLEATAALPAGGVVSFTSPDAFAIGQFGAVNANGWKGAIDEWRLSNVARWTSNFTRPTVPYL